MRIYVNICLIKLSQMALTFYKWTTPQFWYSDLFSIQQVRGTGTNMLKLSPLRSSAQSDPYNNGNNQFTNYFNTSYQCHCVIKHNSHNNPKFQIFASPHGNPRALGNQGWWLPKWHKFLANHAATRSYQKRLRILLNIHKTPLLPHSKTYPGEAQSLHVHIYNYFTLPEANEGDGKHENYRI